MDTIQIDWKNEKQKSLVIELLKEMHIKFRTVAEDREHQLYGEGFKNSILDGKAAYENGETAQFTKINRKDLWK